LFIAAPFQAITLAVLPLSTSAGGIRSVRAHFVDQIFLLHNRTRPMMIVTAIDAGVTVVLTPFLVMHWGLVGAAGATVIAALCAAAASFAICSSRLGLTFPLNHLARIAFATTMMALMLSGLKEPSSSVELSAQIAAGAVVYIVCLGALYASLLTQMFRTRQLKLEAKRAAIVGTNARVRES
jgi:Na+-driven multidrug efflux pump